MVTNLLAVMQFVTKLCNSIDTHHTTGNKANTFVPGKMCPDVAPQLILI